MFNRTTGLISALLVVVVIEVDEGEAMEEALFY